MENWYDSNNNLTNGEINLAKSTKLSFSRDQSHEDNKSQLTTYLNMKESSSRSRWKSLHLNLTLVPFEYIK